VFAPVKCLIPVNNNNNYLGRLTIVGRSHVLPLCYFQPQSLLGTLWFRIKATHMKFETFIESADWHNVIPKFDKVPVYPVPRSEVGATKSSPKNRRGNIDHQ